MWPYIRYLQYLIISTPYPIATVVQVPLPVVVLFRGNDLIPLRFFRWYDITPRYNINIVVIIRSLWSWRRRRRLLGFFCAVLVQGDTSGCSLGSVDIKAKVLFLYTESTVIGARMSHRKWRETKEQLIWWPDLALLGCCLVSLHFLAPITVY